MKKSYGSSLGSRGTPSPFPAVAALLAAGLCGVLLLLSAALRHILGAPVRATFFSILLTPLLVAARLAGQSSPENAWWLAAGVLVLGTLWHFVAPVFKRRAPDAVFLALLAFELFWLARWANSFLPPAGVPRWDILSLPQQLNLVAGVLLPVALAAASLLRPAANAGYESSAPSRITSFLRKRRMPSRIAGAVLMALSVIAVLSAALLAFGGFGSSISETVISPVIALTVFVLADALYWGGKKLWQRLT